MGETGSGPKQKKLYRQFLYPYLILMVLLPLILLIIFNLALLFDMNRSHLEKINTSKLGAQAIFNRELATQTETDVLLVLKQSLWMTQQLFGTKLMVLDATGAVKIGGTDAISEDLKGIAEEAKGSIATLSKSESNLESGTEKQVTFRTRVQKQRFLVRLEPLNMSKTLLSDHYLLVVSPFNQDLAQIIRLNVILVGAVALLFLLGLVVSNVLMNRLNADLSNMTETIASKEQTKIDFLQNFSHDLRTPLMSIQGYAEGIVAGVFPEPTKPAAIIASESLRLKHLVEQLVTLSRLDTAPPLGKKETIALGEYMETVVARYQGLARKEQKHITLNCDQSLRILSDEDLLDKIVGNVLGNAIRYANSQVILDVVQNQEGTVIRIQDDGPGIPADVLPHLFNRFYKGKEGNFGLGLAITKVASDLIGAKVTIENHGNGALCTIELG